MRRRLLVGSGALLIAAAALCHYEAGSRMSERLPRGWRWTASFVGTQAVSDPETGDLSLRGDTTVYARAAEILDDSDRPRSVLVRDAYRIADPATGKLYWEYIYQAAIDPRTGRHASPEHAGDFYVFPRSVDRGETYRLRANYLEGVPLRFVREEDVDGLPTYVFGYAGRAEYTESYIGSADYPGVKIEPGQEIRCADDRFLLRIWVEPVTGEIVKLEESCVTGDYVFDVATGARLAPVMRWEGITTGDDVTRRVQRVRRERDAILLFSTTLPAALLAAGLVLVAAGLVAGRRKPEAEPADEARRAV